MKTVHLFSLSVCLFVVGFSHCTRCADMPCSFDIYSGVISNSLFTSEVVDILFELFFILHSFDVLFKI